MLKFTKESIISAMRKIDSQPELRKRRESHEYDLIYNGKKYPPILVLSEAHKFLGGNELQIIDFGNSTKKAFNIIKDLGFSIQSKIRGLTKDISLDIVNLCNIMADGRHDGSITAATYTEKFKPYLINFKNKYRESPNLFLQNELREFYNVNLNGLDPHIYLKNFGFWGRTIYNFTWSCIFYDFENNEIPASYSPQLYILINTEGIKFGFCYGNYIEDENELVSAALATNNFALLKKCLQNDKNLFFINSPKEDVSASPEKLFKKEDRLSTSRDVDIKNNWSSRSLLIKEFDKENIPENISEIIQNTFLNLKDFFLSILPIQNFQDQELKSNNKKSIPFDILSFIDKIRLSGLHINNHLIKRFVCSLLAKPFVILTGLSGSGKTKLAQAFAMWISEDESQYCLLPVGADWTNREPLLGYPNALKPDEYIKPDNGALDLVIHANNNPNLPFFLILDEMNLSHVERYFADFLSVMESKDEIALFAEGSVNNGVHSKLSLPSNLFIIGTVNIDETTYMFSPKVLDRANTIEFRVTKNEIENFFKNKKELDMSKLNTQGASMAKSFLSLAQNNIFPKQDITEIHNTLILFFEQLKKLGAEFGYRSASEIIRLINQLTIIDSTLTADEKIDIAIMQKLLPKLHGSRRKLCPVLITLGGFCVSDEIKNVEKDIFSVEDFDFDANENVRYRISLEKIARMHRGAIDNGFASYAEA